GAPAIVILSWSARVTTVLKGVGKCPLASHCNGSEASHTHHKVLNKVYRASYLSPTPSVRRLGAQHTNEWRPGGLRVASGLMRFVRAHTLRNMTLAIQHIQRFSDPLTALRLRASCRDFWIRGLQPSVQRDSNFVYSEYWFTDQDGTRHRS